MNHSHGTAVEPSLRIGILVTPQFTLNALANFVDVLRLASDEGDSSGAVRCRYDLMSATGNPEKASCGYPLAPTTRLINPSKLDYIAIVGGLLYRGRTLDIKCCTYLKQAVAIGTPLIGICTGTFLLCRLGLMRDRTICVSWFHHRDLVAEFPNTKSVADVLYVIDRDRITTSGGIGAALAAAALVEQHISREAARKALRIMQISPPTPNLQPAPPLLSFQTNEHIRRALLIMEQHIAETLSIEEIARRLNMSRRSLERLFKHHVNESPKRSYLRLRVQQARILRRMGQSWQLAAKETGFGSHSHLKAKMSKTI
jgi:transcriptional regulator GlxA family with amidase domain